MRTSFVIVACSIACALGASIAGCATGGAGGDDTSSVDSGGARDSTAPKSDGGSGNCPTGYTGAGCKDCAGGFHVCGTECHQDNANTPDAGCTQGCSGACSAPQNATAKCTSDGHCDFACDTSFDKTDGGCECPSGMMVCGNTCQQCCTDTDCVGHQTCNGGTCSGCQPNWGDCNNNASDGCESDLSKEPNCGACGVSCCGWGVSCCFADFHGKSCKASGNTYSCQC